MKNQKKLSPDEVRLAALALLEETDELPVHWLCRALRAEGFRVHFTFVLGAICATDSGMWVMDNRIHSSLRSSLRFSRKGKQ